MNFTHWMISNIYLQFVPFFYIQYNGTVQYILNRQLLYIFCSVLIFFVDSIMATHVLSVVHLFLVADTQLYKTLCPSLGPSVPRYVTH